MLASFCRAAQRAVWLSPQSGAKESAFRGRVLQAQPHPVGNIGGRLDVIAFHINDADRDVDSPLRNLMDDFDLRKFAAGHFQMHFLHRQVKERGKQRGVPAQAHRPAFVVPKTKMGGKAASADYRSDRLSKYFDEAAGILAMGIAAHRGFIECDFITANFDQLLEFFSNNWNQRLGDVPAVLYTPPGLIRPLRV